MTTQRIEADVLIPGRGDPIDKGTVVLEEARIAYAGPARMAPQTPDATVTEVPVAMPGLWESHGHFIGVAIPDLEHATKEPASLKGARSAGDMRRTLLGGVTSVREVGGMGVNLARGVSDGTLVGPTIHAAGSSLSQTAGHGDTHGIPLEWREYAARGGEGFGRLCDGVDECVKAVRLELRRNARVIKVHASGGVMSMLDDPIHQQFSDEELAAIVTEAARADRSVAAHCHGKPGIMAALRAGVRTIEHGTYLDEEAAEMMKRTGAILVPTRFVVDHLLENLDAIPPYAVDKIRDLGEIHREAMEIAVATGVTIAMGTDIFVSGDLYGRNSREIGLLVDAGLSMLEAIESATANGPMTLGKMAPRSGLLSEGYDADVIALRADPLDDASVWGDPDAVTHVWQAGNPVKAP